MASVAQLGFFSLLKLLISFFLHLDCKEEICSGLPQNDYSKPELFIAFSSNGDCRNPPLTQSKNKLSYDTFADPPYRAFWHLCCGRWGHPNPLLLWVKQSRGEIWLFCPLLQFLIWTVLRHAWLADFCLTDEVTSTLRKYEEKKSTFLAAARLCSFMH